MPSSFRQEETWWSRVLFPFFSAAILVPPSHGVAVVLAAFSRPCEVPVKLWLFYPFLCNVPPGVPSLGECAWALSLIEWPTLWLMESSPRQVFDPLPPPQGGPFLWELLAALSHPDPGGTFLSLGQRQMSLCLEAQCSLPQIWAVILLSSRHYTQLPIRQAFPLPADTQDPIILEIREEINLMSFSTALFWCPTAGRQWWVERFTVHLIQGSALWSESAEPSRTAIQPTIVCGGQTNGNSRHKWWV